MEKINVEEIWAPVLNYDGKYEASSLGRIRSLNYLHTGKVQVLKPGLNHRGYLQVVLCKDGKPKTLRVNRVVFSAFNGPIPPGMHVDHINNVRTDNRLQNLQLLSGADNTRKAWLGRKHTEESKKKISTSKKGEKFSEETRAKMRAAQKARREREKAIGNK